MAHRRRRRRNPESHRERVRAAKLGWRRRRHNPESTAERRAAAKRGWAHRRRRSRNPRGFFGHSAEHARDARMESRRERSSAARKGWAHRRRRRHNPFRGGMGDITRDLTAAGIGGAAAVALDVLLAYLPIPVTFQSGWGKVATVAAGALALGWGTGKVMGRRTGAMVAVGALTVDAYNAIKLALAPTIGSTVKGLSGLADFEDYSTGVGAYMPGDVSANPAPYLPAGASGALPAPPMQHAVASASHPMGAYMQNMGAYMQGNGMGMGM